MGTALRPRLSATTHGPREALGRPAEPPVSDADAPPPTVDRTWLQALRAAPGRATLDPLWQQLAKLARSRARPLPPALCDALPPSGLHAYRQRMAVEAPPERRRQAVPLRLPLLAACCLRRGRARTDLWVAGLLALGHRLGAQAARQVENVLVAARQRGHGQTGRLYRLAAASLAHPTGVGHEGLLPVVREAPLRDLVKEGQATGPFSRAPVQTGMRRADRSHSRRRLPPLLEARECRSHNATPQRLLRALTRRQRARPRRGRPSPVAADGPRAGGSREHWRAAVLATDPQGRQRRNRLSYALGVLPTLRDQLRCQDVWVGGAERYRNPAADGPPAFAVHRPTYEAALTLPAHAADFLQPVHHARRDARAALDRTLPRHGAVEILPQATGWSTLSPWAPQPAPSHWLALQLELSKRWPMPSLLEVRQDTDLRVALTRLFRSPTAWETLARAPLQYRLWLALYGRGTGAGFKRGAMGNQGLPSSELRAGRRRCITPEAVRQRMAAVVHPALCGATPPALG